MKPKQNNARPFHKYRHNSTLLHRHRRNPIISAPNDDDLTDDTSSIQTKRSSGSWISAVPLCSDHQEDTDDFLQSVREKRDRLVERLRIYNNLLKFHKSIKQDQVYLYKRLQDMDELYLRNTGAILRLGFCPCLVHQQTSPVGDLLMKIHRKLRIWDKKIEEICELVKEPSTIKTAEAILSILQINESTPLGRMTMADFNDVSLPDIVWDLTNPFIEEINLPPLISEWKVMRTDVRESLCKVEIKFKEICVEFGVRRGPAEVPSSGRRSSTINTAVGDETDEDYGFTRVDADYYEEISYGSLKSPFSSSSSSIL